MVFVRSACFGDVHLGASRLMGSDTLMAGVWGTTRVLEASPCCPAGIGRSLWKVHEAGAASAEVGLRFEAARGIAPTDPAPRNSLADDRTRLRRCARRMAKTAAGDCGLSSCWP